MSFKDRVVIVTGASSGIGAATAIAFSKEGAKVTIVGRNETKLSKTASSCASVGEPPLIILADIAKRAETEKVVKSTIEKFGKIDVLINNAGIIKTGSIIGGKVMDSYDEIMDINLRAAVNLTALATPALSETKGNIINISSIAATTTPLPPSIGYYMSKAALNHFSRGAALELAPLGIRVNVICPGPVRTDIIDNSDLRYSWEKFAMKTVFGRVSDPEEVADLILYIASDKAKSMTGSCYVIDNGTSLKV